MTDDVTAYGGIIDQRAMSTEERHELAAVLRGQWWDCHHEFVRPIIDLETLRLSNVTMHALAADLDEAGYHVHARIVRRAAAPQGQAFNRPITAQRHWRPRVHHGSAVHAARC